MKLFGVIPVYGLLIVLGTLIAVLSVTAYAHNVNIEISCVVDDEVVRVAIDIFVCVAETVDGDLIVGVDGAVGGVESVFE